MPPSLHPSGCIYEWLVHLPPGALPTFDSSATGLCVGYSDKSPTLLTTTAITARTDNSEDTATTAAFRSQHSNHCGISASEVAFVLKMSTPTELHTNDTACLRFGRALITLDARRGRELTRIEYDLLVNVWVSRAKPFFRAEVSEEEYRDKLQRTYTDARVTFDDTPIALVLKAVQSRPLPHYVLVYKTRDLQITAAVVIEMQRWAGVGHDFKLSGRMLQSALELADPKRGWWLIKKLEQRPEPLLRCTYRALPRPVWPVEIWGALE